MIYDPKSTDALIAHRRRMGMIPEASMPETTDEDCGCGGSFRVQAGKKIARPAQLGQAKPRAPIRAPIRAPRGVKEPRFAHLKIK